MDSSEQNKPYRFFGTQEAGIHGFRHAEYNNAPIGVFDSGFGGLTVAREIMKALPNESIIYFGDTLHCPYGPRSFDEVKGFVDQIGSWLVERGVKMIVIACNTATAAGLQHAQVSFPVPVIGVVEPGARAAARATRNRRVGVIATKGTVESGVYTKAIRNIDAGITVFSTATPRFVEIAELGLRMAKGPIENYTSLASQVYIRPEFQEIAQDYLDPLRRCDVDTLVLGCTHFPLLKSLIGGVMGRDVVLISSASEVARDCKDMLARQGICASPEHEPTYQFYTSGSDLEAFRRFGTRVLRFPLDSLQHVVL
jgi:glutamate racemase